jgi:hypothetical protein
VLVGCLGLSPSTGPASGGPGESPASSPAANASTGPSPGSSPASSVVPVAGKPAPCPGSDRTLGAPAGRQLLGTSTNWSGYVAAIRKTGVTCVEGSWVEPSVTCSRTGHQAVAIWIGMDGFSAKVLGIPSTDVLVQIGTQVDCDNGVASHGAWHEILPGEHHEVPVAGLIRAGDHLSARIAYAGGQFTMAIYDAETAFAFSLRAAAPGAPRKTAEWIVEAPAADCPGTCAPVPLPRFGAIRFTNAHATIAGQRSSIDDDSWTNVKLRMVRAGIARTATSSLTADGTSFRVTWLHR